MVSVGLASNFAALRALATEGLQKGHMRLHARNVAISAGVPLDLLDKCVKHMTELGKINAETARDFLVKTQQREKL